MFPFWLKETGGKKSLFFFYGILCKDALLEPWQLFCSKKEEIREAQRSSPEPSHGQDADLTNFAPCLSFCTFSSQIVCYV